MKDYVVDFEYLALELDQQNERIQTLKALIIEQADSMEKRRNKTVGVFIAIYVPLAFATVSGIKPFTMSVLTKSSLFSA